MAGIESTSIEAGAPTPRRRLSVPVALAVGALLALAYVALTPSAPRAFEPDALGPPQLEDTNPDPDVFEAELVAQRADIDVGDGEGGEQIAKDAFTFNGVVPGPEIRVKVGDTVIIHFRSELGPREEVGTTGIHWHGIEVPNRSDGTAVTQNGVGNGEEFTYKFIAVRPGVFWYHPHHHPGNPVFKGQYGSLIVTEGTDSELQDLGVVPGPEDTQTLVLGDMTICDEEGENPLATFPAGLPWAGEGDTPVNDFQPTPRSLCEFSEAELWPDNQVHGPRDHHGHTLDENGDPLPPLEAGAIPSAMGTKECEFAVNIECETREGQLVLANGRVAAPREAHNPDGEGGAELDPAAPGVLEVEAGQGVRLQTISTTVHRYLRLQMTDHEGEQLDLVRIGGEGGLIDRARLEGGAQGGWDTKFDRGELLLAPSDRTDAVVSIPADAEEGDVLTLWTRDFRRVGGFANLPTVPVMHMRVVGEAAEPYALAPGDRLRTHPAIADPVESIRDEPTAELLDPSTFAEPLPGSPDEEIALTNSGGSGPTIDLVNGDLDEDLTENGEPVPYTEVPHPESARFARVGDLIELKISNETGQHHPFHPHGFSFQPVRMQEAIRSEQGEITGWETIRNFGYREFIDTHDIPPGHRLVYRVRLEERPVFEGIGPEGDDSTATTPRGGAAGRWVFHCHIFQHAFQGMISEIVAVDSPVATAEPDRLDLGRTRIGRSSDPGPVEISNPSASQPDPLEIDAVSITGRDADDFTLSEEGCDGQALGTDESCGIAVRLEPTARGPREASLTLESNDHESPLVVPLIGHGVPSGFQLGLRLPRGQGSLRRVRGDAICRREDCRASGRGTLLVRHAGGRVSVHGLPRISRRLREGRWRRARWPVPRRARRVARRAARNGGKVVARVRLRARGIEPQVARLRFRRVRLR